MTGGSLDVIWEVSPKKVLKVFYLLGTADHLITHLLGQQQKFRVLLFIFSEKDKAVMCTSDNTPVPSLGICTCPQMDQQHRCSFPHLQPHSINLSSENGLQ